MSYGFVITEMGKNLLAKLGTGEQLQITRIMVGKGELAEGQNPADFTDLVQPVAQATSTLPLVKENTLSFIVEYRNDLNGGLEEGFWLKEFGVFAQDGENEILLYYATLGDFPQYVQAYINGVVNIKRYPVTIAVSDKTEVVISYNALAFVTEERMKEFSETDTIPYLEGVLEETENKIQQKLDEKANVVHEHGADEITSGILPVERGGTGATTAADARTNLGITPANIGAAASSHGTHVTFSTTAPVMDGTASVGTATTVSRSDHKHPTDTSRAAASHTHNYAGSSSAGGAATSAVKLQTARTIDGMNFDGSANITHFGVCNTAANTAAKTVTLSGFVLTEGARIAVFFANTNTASNLTLNVNGTGAKAISCIKGYYAPVGQWEANQIVEFVYYSSHWIMLTANARRLTTARSIRTNLSSTSASNFDGTANITPGVTGTLPIANGGTGATSASAARTALGAFSSSGGTINGNVRINGTVAEGNSNTTASGNYSHAEGFYSTANGHYSHAEGYGCIADGAYGAHANGMSTVASSYGNVLFIKSISGKTITIDSSGKYQSVSEIKAILAQFISNQEIYVIDTYYVNSSYTKYTISSVNTTNCTITVDRDLPTSNFAPWMVVNLNVRYTKGFYQTYAEGSFCVSIGNESHAEGHKTVARGSKSHAEGESTVAYGSKSHAEGESTVAYGSKSHAEGYRTQAIGPYSHASGLDTIAYETNDFVMGQYNKNVPTNGSLNLSNYLTIGNGSSSARSNCFRVTHANGIFANAAYKTSGADYAELFQWFDDNPENEDRVGLFVTLVGERIRIAKPTDKHILGIVSACPSVLGDVYDDQWKGMYQIDIYGRPILEEVEVPAETMEIPDPENSEQTITKVIREAHTEMRQKLNPDYDPTQEYIPRSERPEWEAVGMLGKLVAIDDGTCEVGSYCMAGKDGIATKAEQETKFYVMARLDKNHIKVMIW